MTLELGWTVAITGAATAISLFGGIMLGRKGKVDKEAYDQHKDGCERRFQDGEKDFSDIKGDIKTLRDDVTEIKENVAVLVDREKRRYEGG